jgi:uncharacterized RDD family membrane protein YckC
MSDPNQPPRPEGSGDEPTPPDGSETPPPPPPTDPYAGPASGGGAYGQPAYGQPDYGQPAGQPDYGQQFPQQPGPDQPGGQPAYGAPGEQPGGLGSRFLARLIDGLLVGIVATIVEVILAGIFGLSSGGAGFGGSYAYSAIAGIISAVFNLGYFGYLESKRGQTVGKMALKLHVQTMSGGLPTFEQAIKRNAWLALPILGIVPVVGPLIGSLGELVAVIMIAVGISSDAAMRRPWTDKYAETRVLKRPS